MKPLQKALDLVLPPRCVVSGEEVDRQGMLAPDVWGQLKFIAAPQCVKCGLPFDYDVEEETVCGGCIENDPVYTSARSALVYDDGSRNLVLRFKHADQTHSVLAFVPWLKKAGAEFLNKADYFVPVPLHRWRLLKRRYNQAAIMAWALSKDMGVPCLVDGLQRLRATKSQGYMKAKERKANVKKAFAINPKHESKLEGKTVVLIDDVLTTGATVNECVKALKRQDVKDVHVLTLARVVR